MKEARQTEYNKSIEGPKASKFLNKGHKNVNTEEIIEVLERQGFENKDAIGLAIAINGKSGLATKEDIHSVREDLRETETSLREDLRETETNLKEDIRRTETRIREEIALLDKRIEVIDKRIEVIDKRIDALEKQVEALNKRMDNLDKQLVIIKNNQKWMMWVMGISIGLSITILIKLFTMSL